MSEFLICSVKAGPQRRGRAHEEALCEQILSGSRLAGEWLREAGAPGPLTRVLASPLGGTHKADIFFRGFGEKAAFAGRLSAKLCTPSVFDPTSGYRNHLHGCGAGSSVALGLIPPDGEESQAARSALLLWQSGASLAEMSLVQKSVILDWLSPRWGALCDKFVFGSPEKGGHGAVSALICTIAKPDGDRLVAQRSVAFSPSSFHALRLFLGNDPKFVDACGGCFGDGVVSVQSRGSKCGGLQAKINIEALIAASDARAALAPTP